jgi:hypothetical protein
LTAKINFVFEGAPECEFWSNGLGSIFQNWLGARGILIFGIGCFSSVRLTPCAAMSCDLALRAQTRFTAPKFASRLVASDRKLLQRLWFAKLEVTRLLALSVIEFSKHRAALGYAIEQ